MTASLQRGQFPVQLELTWAFLEAFSPMTTWPTAAITAYDFYEISGTDGQSTYTYLIWLGTNMEGDDVTLPEDCSFTTTQ